MQIRIIQNCFRPEQLADCTFEPYLNAVPSTPDERYLFFESQVIRDLVLKGWHAECDWFGVFGHRWQAKLDDARSWVWPIRNLSRGPVTMDDLQRLASAHPDADILSIGRFLPHAVFSVGEAYHPGLVEAADRLLERIGVRFDLEQTIPQPIYFNFFVARRHAIEAFVRDLLAPAIDAATQDPVLRRLCFRNARYIRPWPADLRELYGIDHYPLHPFIGERLINVQAMLSGLKVVAFDRSDEPGLGSRAAASAKAKALSALGRVRRWRWLGD